MEKIELNGLETLRLLSAYHALRMPEGAYGISYREARKIITDMVGFCPEGGEKIYGASFEGCCKWLGLTEAEYVVLCDVCALPVELDEDGLDTYHTDDEVCGGGDGPGFYLHGSCGRACCDEPVEVRRALYSTGREKAEAQRKAWRQGRGC